MTAATFNFTENQGATWTPVFRWATDVLISKPITAITKATPAVVTAAAHGIPDGWPAAIASAQGMTQINTPNFPPRGSDWHQATKVDADTVNFNKIDSSNYTTYVSGGFLVYPTPIDLSTVSAMSLAIYDNPLMTGTPLATLSVGSGLTLNNTTKTISGVLNTAGLTWTTGYYELLGTIGGIVTQLVSGTITLLP